MLPKQQLPEKSLAFPGLLQGSWLRQPEHIVGLLSLSGSRFNALWTYDLESKKGWT
jgi:hypothetical protein